MHHMNFVRIIPEAEGDDSIFYVQDDYMQGGIFHR